jgi:hypothetical protein
MQSLLVGIYSKVEMEGYVVWRYSKVPLLLHWWRRRWRMRPFILQHCSFSTGGEGDGG